jgi:hypothetical protein
VVFKDAPNHPIEGKVGCSCNNGGSCDFAIQGNRLECTGDPCCILTVIVLGGARLSGVATRSA